MENSEIKIFTFGCRLNLVEAMKIRAMLTQAELKRAIIVNTCGVTSEAMRQSRQAIRKLVRENSDTPIFVTGCAATAAPSDYNKISPNIRVISNPDKLKISAYLPNISECKIPRITDFSGMSKAFVQIQNGCSYACTYCITRLLRGQSVSIPYKQILADTQELVDSGFSEIVLTGVNIAEYSEKKLSQLCSNLLSDIPGISRLRLSSMDPASKDLKNIIDLMHSNPKMLPHLHLSMQSASDEILTKMGRRHNVQMVRELVDYAGENISLSWDLICGFPGETNELFNDTIKIINELKPIRLHAFPFSPRPGTPAATMQNQINRTESKRRVKISNDSARKNMLDFMKKQIGKTTQLLIEENNIGRTPDDISVKIHGNTVPEKTICNAKLIQIDEENLIFIGEV